MYSKCQINGYFFCLSPVISHFIHLLLSMCFLLLVSMHFAYISCCYVGQTSDKLCGRQEQPFVNRVCMESEYITKVPYSTIAS